ncbi:MAG: YceI family protein [Actinocatenispora sp.]
MSATGVSVSIETQDGWPVSGAILTLTDLTGQQAGIAVANERGEAVLTGTAAGQYTAIFTAPGFSPSATVAFVSQGRIASMGTVKLDRVASSNELPPAGVWTIDPVHTMLNLAARHAGISSVRGRLTDFEGQAMITTPVENSTLRVTIRAESVDTANKMRDDHLRSADFLNVEEFPTIEYEGTGLTPAGPDRWTVHGNLTMCGEVRAVDLDLNYLGTDVDPWGMTRAGFRASAQLHREDFKMRFAQRLATGIALVGSTLRLDLDVEMVQGDKAPEF